MPKKKEKINPTRPQIDVAGWEQQFKKIFKYELGYRGEVKIEFVDYCEHIEVTLTKGDQEGFPLNFAKMLQVAQIFGTLNFDVNNMTEAHHWKYSSWTQGTDYETTQTFTVKWKNLNEGLGINFSMKT